MSPSSFLTVAGSLTLLFATSALAGAPMHGAHMMRTSPPPRMAGPPPHAPAPHVQAFRQVKQPEQRNARFDRDERRFARHDGRRAFTGRTFAGFVGGGYYGAPVAPDYVPAEPPLAAAYGEPQLLPPRDLCRGPAIHYVSAGRSGPVPQVIYGIQPPCGPSGPAPVGNAGGHVRAAY
jgi:hypothetical protein